MYGIIYKATNRLNGKVYIGQTTKTLGGRKSVHRWRANSPIAKRHSFQEAIKKYDFDNFTWEIIDSAHSKEGLFKKEVYWIRHYNATGDGGYNEQEGGEIPIKPMKPVNQYDLKGNLIKKFESATEASREIGCGLSDISLCARDRKDRIGNFFFLYPTDISEKDLEKESKRRVEKINSRLKTNTKRKREVCSFSKDLEFRSFTSITEASNSINSNNKTVKQICEGIVSQTKDYTFFYKEDIPKEGTAEHKTFIEKVKSRMNKEPREYIVRRSLNGDTQIFSSLKEVCETLSMSRYRLVQILKSDTRYYDNYFYFRPEEFTDDEFRLKKEMLMEKENNLFSDNYRHNRVLQYDLHGNFIAFHRNQSTAHRATGTNRSSISNCCNGIRESSNGFIWLSQKDYNSQDEIDVELKTRIGKEILHRNESKSCESRPKMEYKEEISVKRLGNGIGLNLSALRQNKKNK